MLLRSPYCRPFVALSRSAVRPSHISSMPLRAKILEPAMRSIVTETGNVSPIRGDTPDDVLFNSSFGVRTIELNRPKKLNSLDGSMCRKIIPQLREWEKSDMITAVILKGAGEKALCAGGDVATLAGWCQEGVEGQRRSSDYFALEYKLDHLIASYSKPYIAFMDGATMGGGVGLSMHAPFRIATERTNLAMPETRIGFFPEVGASFFLSRLEGSLGKYLALTSESLRGVQAFYHGFATHYVHSSSLADLENRLAELTIPDYASAQDRLKVIDATISEFATSVPHDQPMQISGELRRYVDFCFAPADIYTILSRLQQTSDSSAVSEGVRKWATKTLSTIGERSPTSLKVTLKQLSLGSRWSIAEAFRREHLIATRFMAHPDFVEGVTARLIRKPAAAPQWQPAKLEAVSQAAVDEFFATPEGQPRLAFFNEGPNANYSQYPHAWLALPTETHVRELLELQSLPSHDAVLAHFLQSTGGKVGVREKITEILQRMTVVEGVAVAWKQEPLPVEQKSAARE